MSILIVVDLPGAVRPDVTDELARLERQRHAVDRDAVLVLAREKRAERAQGPRRALAGTKDFAQVARFYDRQDPSVRRCVLLLR